MVNCMKSECFSSFCKRNLWLLAVFIAVVILQAKAQEETVDQLTQKVIEKCPLSHIKDKNLHRVFSEPNLEVSREVKCLEACILKNLGVINEAGHFDRKAARRLNKLQSGGNKKREKIDDEISEICGAINETDECETAHQLVSCGVREMKARGDSLLQSVLP